MAPSESSKFKNIRITGTIDVQKVKPRAIPDRWTGFATPVLIMGPTGAGKSSFIEAIGGLHSSTKNLSSGNLEGFTQDVSEYQIKGITCRDWTIHLIDTPGFADDKISVLEIVTKVQKLFKAKCSGVMPLILYFTPITCIRLPRSQRQVLKTFQSLTGSQAAGGLTIVTTMWDTVWSEQVQKRAESNYEEFLKDIWKDFIDNQAKMAKFYNTQASALKVLDIALTGGRTAHFHMETEAVQGREPTMTVIGESIYNDLVERIQSLRRRKEVIGSQISELSINQEVKMILETEMGQVNKTLAKFEKQLAQFCPTTSLATRLHRQAMLLFRG